MSHKQVKCHTLIVVVLFFTSNLKRNTASYTHFILNTNVIQPQSHSGLWFVIILLTWDPSFPMNNPNPHPHRQTAYQGSGHGAAVQAGGPDEQLWSKNNQNIQLISNPLCYLPGPRARQFTKQSLPTVHLPTFEAYIRGKTTPLAMPTKEDMTYKMCKAS